MKNKSYRIYSIFNSVSSSKKAITLVPTDPVESMHTPRQLAYQTPLWQESGLCTRSLGITWPSTSKFKPIYNEIWEEDIVVSQWACFMTKLTCSLVIRPYWPGFTGRLKNGSCTPILAAKTQQRTCNGFVLQMAHFYSKKSIVKKSL